MATCGLNAVSLIDQHSTPYPTISLISYVHNSYTNAVLLGIIIYELKSKAVG